MSEELKGLQKKLDKLSNILSKAGVKTETWVEISSGDFGYNVDFSEHDKVFEDEIVKLENRILKMEGEKKYLRTRCMEDAVDAFDRGCYGALTIIGRRVHVEEENKKLKQRIAELESELEKKECIKTMRIEFYADNEEMLTPLEVANSLINQNTFKVDELRELAEHLQVYCRHHNDKKKDAISF